MDTCLLSNFWPFSFYFFPRCSRRRRRLRWIFHFFAKATTMAMGRDSSAVGFVLISRSILAQNRFVECKNKYSRYIECGGDAKRWRDERSKQKTHSLTHTYTNTHGQRIPQEHSEYKIICNTKKKERRQKRFRVRIQRELPLLLVYLLQCKHQSI